MFLFLHFSDFFHYEDIFLFFIHVIKIEVQYEVQYRSAIWNKFVITDHLPYIDSSSDKIYTNSDTRNIQKYFPTEYVSSYSLTFVYSYLCLHRSIYRSRTGTHNGGLVLQDVIHCVMILLKMARYVIMLKITGNVQWDNGMMIFFAWKFSISLSFFNLLE